MGSAKKDGRQLMDGVTMALLAAVKALIIIGGKPVCTTLLNGWSQSDTCSEPAPSVLIRSAIDRSAIDKSAIDRSAVNRTVCRQNILLDRQRTQSISKETSKNKNFFSSLHLKLLSYNESHIILVIWGSIRSSSNLNEERLKQSIQNISRAEIAFLCDCKDHIYR